MNQRGFASILVIGIVVAIIAIGAGGYFYVSNQSDKEPVQDLPANESEPASTGMPVPGTGDVPEMIVEEESEDASLPGPAIAPPAAPKLTPVPAPELTPAPRAEIPVPKSACARVFAPKYGSGPYYTGSLFDAHFHLPSLIDYTKAGVFSHEGISFQLDSVTSPILDKNVILADLICTLKKERVRGVIGFGVGDEAVLEEVLKSANSIRQRAPGFIHMFIAPVGFNAATLESIQVSNSGLFEGYGELSFGFGGGLPSNANPDDQTFLDIYKVAGKHSLIVMIHVGAQQQGRIENILQKNPNVKFLFHGPESENFIHAIIGKYPNAYYSIDAMLIRLPSAPGALMYMVNSKDEFKTKFAQNYSTMLNNTASQWKAKIEQYPDRYMWGTDRAHLWTYDEDVGALIEEFARDFIGKLSSSVQENFAYKNAEKLLQEQ